MATVKEGSRAHLFLSICAENSDFGPDGPDGRITTRYWYVRTDAWSSVLSERVPITGGGDAAVLKSLVRKALIRDLASPLGSKYCYAITAKGLAELARHSNDALREAFSRCKYFDEEAETYCGAPPSAMLHEVTEKYPISPDNHPFQR